MRGSLSSARLSVMQPGAASARRTADFQLRTPLVRSTYSGNSEERCSALLPAERLSIRSASCERDRSHIRSPAPQAAPPGILQSCTVRTGGERLNPNFREVMWDGVHRFGRPSGDS